MNSPEIPHNPPHHKIIEQAIMALGDTDPTKRQLLEDLRRANRTDITVSEKNALVAAGVTEEVLNAHFTNRTMLTEPDAESAKASEPSFN